MKRKRFTFDIVKQEKEESEELEEIIDYGEILGVKEYEGRDAIMHVDKKPIMEIPDHINLNQMHLDFDIKEALNGFRQLAALIAVHLYAKHFVPMPELYYAEKKPPSKQTDIFDCRKNCESPKFHL
jgi:hypothetical protein